MSDAHHSTAIRLRRRRIGAIAVMVGLALAISAWWVTRPTRAELEQGVFDAFARNDLAQAEVLLLQISPRDADVLPLLSVVCEKTGRKREAIQWHAQLAELSDSPRDGFLSAGARAFEWGLPHDAERLYRRALELDPQSIKPYGQLARLYLAWQRETALRSLIAQADNAEVAIEADPMLLWLWVIGDRVQWLEDDSQKWLERAHHEQPDEPYVAAALAGRWLALKRSDRARAIVDVMPQTSSPRWPVAVAQTAIQLADGDDQDAVADLEPFTDGGEEQAATWFVRGQAWLKVGDADKALQAFTQASRLDPWFVAALHERGRLLVKNGDPQAGHQLEVAARTDELVRRCLQLAQSTRPDEDDLKAVAVLAADLGAIRWTQLVCRVGEQQNARIQWPDNVKALRDGPAAKLSIEKPLELNIALAKRRTAVPSTRFRFATDPPTEASHRISFTETTRELGLNFVYEFGHSQERWLIETLGGGVAVLDFDADGWPDLFFAQGGLLRVGDPQVAAAGTLLRNLQGESLSDVTESAQVQVRRYSHGCAVGDVNEDGFADLLVCHFGGLTLLLNQGDGTWQEVTESAGLTNDRWNTSAAFVDLDRDGDLDLYVVRYCVAPLTNDLRVCRDGGRAEPCRPNAYPAEPDAVFENLGEGRFADRSVAWGIASQSGYGLGVVAADFDDDGTPEVFVGNDSTHNFLWRSIATKDGALKFEERSLLAGVAVDGTGRAEASMGIAGGDVDGDQRLDLFVTTFFDETSTLFQNVGDLQFEDRSQQRGVSNSGQRLMGWGAQFFDANNDGWLDLALVNGHLHDRPQSPQFFLNERGQLADVSSQMGPYFRDAKLGRSLATWDYNRDGRVDLVTSHQRGPASVLRNDSRGGRSLVLRLIGTRGPRDATGAVVRARVGNRWLMRLVSTQGGYLSANSADVVIGLGDVQAVDELEVRWPTGLRQRFTELKAGRRIVIREEEAEVVQVP